MKLTMPLVNFASFSVNKPQTTKADSNIIRTSANTVDAVGIMANYNRCAVKFAGNSNEIADKADENSGLGACKKALQTIMGNAEKLHSKYSSTRKSLGKGADWKKILDKFHEDPDVKKLIEERNDSYKVLADQIEGLKSEEVQALGEEFARLTSGKKGKAGRSDVIHAEIWDLGYNVFGIAPEKADDFVKGISDKCFAKDVEAEISEAIETRHEDDSF